MSDYRDLLEQERRRHAMRDGTVRGLERRRNRKRRNGQIVAGIVALLIAAAGVGGGLYAFRAASGVKPGVNPNPSSSPSVAPTPSETGPVDQGAPPASVSGPLQFVDDQHGWMVDGDGQILATVDGGKNWILQASGPSNIKEIQFVDERHGWGVGDGGLIQTTDGGTHWVTWSNQSLSTVQFVTPKIGWAVEAAGGPNGVGAIMKTVDGGLTWTKSGPEVNTVCFSSDNLGWAAGPHEGGIGLFRTEDAGATWKEFPLPMPGGDYTGWLATVRCGGDAAWLVGQGDGGAGHLAYAVFRMGNGDSQPEACLQDAYTHPMGEGNLPAASNPYPGPLSAPDAQNARFITWCPACGGELPFVSLETTQDRGANWSNSMILDSKEPAEPLGISFVDRDHGWVLLHDLQTNSTFVLATSDGGQSWERP
jgi:photosystem II stability/assembly factor-like uncharacterized protein